MGGARCPQNCLLVEYFFAIFEPFIFTRDLQRKKGRKGGGQGEGREGRRDREKGDKREKMKGKEGGSEEVPK